MTEIQFRKLAKSRKVKSLNLEIFVNVTITI